MHLRTFLAMFEKFNLFSLKLRFKRLLVWPFGDRIQPKSSPVLSKRVKIVT